MQKISFDKKLALQFFAGMILSVFLTCAAIAQIQQPTSQPYYPTYNQAYDPNNNNENYTARSPYKLEIARFEATVYRAGEEPIPLSQIPRLNKGDVLKVKIANEAVNGVMPHQSNWDWTLLVAFINPSVNTASDDALSQEVRLREKGWYNDNFFTVPYDSQPIIFLYPKAKYRSKILDLIQRRPDDVRQMGEKVIEISSAYGHISQFLTQVQFMMARPDYNNGLLAQSIEGAARTFGVNLPTCWNSYGYGYSNYSYNSQFPGTNDLAARAQCLSQNVRVEDLNYSVGKMLQQGGLMAIAQLRQSHPEISKWIQLVAIAIDFIMRLTAKSSIRIIPAVVSTPENPIFAQSGYYGGTGFYGGYSPTNYFQPSAGNSFSSPNTEEANKVTLLANYQPSDKEFVTVYTYVPHKWQAEPDPSIASLYAPQLIEPCFHTGKNLLRNTDLRVEWLSDNFTRDFKLVLDDNNGWKKEFALRKNLGLNAWEVEISKEELAALPQNNTIDAKITGKRGFTLIESPIFKMPISNGGTFEATFQQNSNGKRLVFLKRLSGDRRCSQSIIYRPSNGQPVIFPLTQENSFLRMNEDGSEIIFEIDGQNAGETIQVQQYGGEMLNVTSKTK